MKCSGIPLPCTKPPHSILAIHLRDSHQRRRRRRTRRGHGPTVQGPTGMWSQGREPCVGDIRPPAISQTRIDRLSASKQKAGEGHGEHAPIHPVPSLTFSLHRRRDAAHRPRVRRLSDGQENVMSGAPRSRPFPLCFASKRRRGSPAGGYVRLTYAILFWTRFNSVFHHISVGVQPLTPRDIEA